MAFAYGAAVTRQRRRLTPDPYSGTEAPGDWSQPVEALIEGAWVASSSSSRGSDPIRSQVSTAKSLYCDPDDDVLVGDRILADGVTYTVSAKPSADTNPFTGWQPVNEIPLTEVSG